MQYEKYPEKDRQTPKKLGERHVETTRITKNFRGATGDSGPNPTHLYTGSGPNSS